MRAKLACICRGNGKVYVLFEVSEVTQASTIEASCLLSNGNPVIFQRIDLVVGGTSRRVAIVFPLSPHTITLSLACSSKNNSEQAAIIYRRALSPTFIKWASRYNYRLNPQRASLIRDCEKDHALTQDEIEISGLVPMGDSTVYRCNAIMPNGKSSEYQIAVLDDQFVDARIEPIEMGTSSIPKGMTSPVDRFTVLFSIELPQHGIDYSIVLYRNNRLAAFETISKQRFASLENDFNKKTQNATCNPEYELWLEKHRARNAELLAQSMIEFQNAPLISIVVPLHNTSPERFRETYAGVASQSYAKWELVAVDAVADGQELPNKLRTLADADARVRPIAAGSDADQALCARAGIGNCTGEYTAVLSPGDLLAPNALYEFVLALNADPDIDIFYSDSDQVDAQNKHFNPHFKPDYSEYLMRETNYMQHFNVVRTSLLKRIDLGRSTISDAQAHDMLLKCLEQTSNVRHCPKILCSSRVSPEASNHGSASSINAAIKLAVESHLERLGIDASVAKSEIPGLVHTHYKVAGSPKVSIIIPTKDNKDVLVKCIKSIIGKSTYTNFEILVVENNSEDPTTFGCYEVLQELDSRVNVLTWEGAFNYPDINNFGAERATGDYLLFLNNDTEVISSDWIEELLGICQQDNVGAVGAKLLYPDGTIQHGGIAVQASACDHINSHLSQDARGYFNTAVTTREVSAVTAACLMCPRTVFFRVGGFDREYAVAYNDVDLCMKMQAAGYKVVFNPNCMLYHYESLSRDRRNTMQAILRDRKELSLLAHRWSDHYVVGDPFMNANLDTWNTYFNIPKQVKD